MSESCVRILLSVLLAVAFSIASFARPVTDESNGVRAIRNTYERDVAELDAIWGNKTQVGFGTTNAFKYPIFVQPGLKITSLDELEAKFKGKRTTTRVKNGPGEYILVLDVHSDDCKTCQKRWPWELPKAMAEGWILSVMKFGDAQFGIATRGSDYEKMLDAMATAPTKKSDLLPEAAKLLWEQSYEFGHQRVRIFGGQHAESKSNLESAFREHMGKIGFVEGTNRSNPESTGETFFINPRGGAYYFETEPEGKFMAYYAE